MMPDICWLILGLIVLVVGGELLVRGAVGIATALEISPLVIGLTVVSFGTSAPELLVSLNAAMEGSPGIAMGNVMGSNVANLALVLGVTVLIFPIAVDRQTKIIDWPMMMFTSLLLFVFCWDLEINRWEGITLVVILITFTIWLIRKSRKDSKKKKVDTDDDIPEAPKSISKSIGYLALGLVGLYFGSEWLLDGAVGIAQSLGMEERIIGLTIVAFGTSAPELVASCVAAFRQQTDISIGNLIGSNIFNVCAVLGITSTVTDINVDQAIMNSDIYWMLGVSLLILPMMLIGKKIGRLKGFILVGGYVFYIGLLVMNS